MLLHQLVVISQKFEISDMVAIRMKGFIPEMVRVLEKLGILVLSKTRVGQRTVRRTEAHKRKELEAERLDRLRNPGNYRGK